MIQAFLTLLLLLWPNANAYKIAVFAPEAANSQVFWGECVLYSVLLELAVQYNFLGDLQCARR